MTDVASMSLPQRRAVLARGAAATPGFLYHGSDLAAVVPEAQRADARRALIGTVDRAMDEIPAGKTMTCAFGMLSYQDRPQGSWTAEIDGPATYAPLLAPAPALDLPAGDDLRAWVSAQAETTPDTVYLTQTLLTTLEPKTLADGSVLGPIQIAAMLLCSACAEADLTAADFEIHVVRCLPKTRAATIRVRVRRTAAPA